MFFCTHLSERVPPRITPINEDNAIGLGLTIPSLLLLGFGHSFVAVVGAGLLFGIGYGIFDANNMPILCQFVSARYRATAYGIMNI